MKNIQAIMTRGVITAHMDDTLEEIEQTMSVNKIGHIFIVDQGKLRGIISDVDLKRRKSFLADKDIANTRESHTLSLKAHQFMSRGLKSLRADAPIIAAIDLIIEYNIHCLPIVDRHDHLIGVVSDTDLLKEFRNLLDWERLREER